MSGASALEKADAKRLLPPAAHRAQAMLSQTRGLVVEIGQLEAALEDCLASRPHDKTEILRLVDMFKKRAMTLHGQAVTACLAIKDGR